MKKIQIMIKKINKLLLDAPSQVGPFCPFLVIFILLLASPSSIKAMDEDCLPVGKNLWTSDRVKELKKNIKSKSPEFNQECLELCKNSLKCSMCNGNQGSHQMTHTELLLPSDKLTPITDGRSGNKVFRVSRESKDIMYIKEFKNEEEWAKELRNSLAAEEEMTQLAPKLNIVHTLDAFICGNSRSIVTKAIEGPTVWDCLSKNDAELSKAVMRACGAYLRKLRKKTSQLLNEKEKIEICRIHAEKLFPTLADYPLEPAPRNPLFSFSLGRQAYKPEAINARNINEYLSEDENLRFVYSLIKTFYDYNKDIDDAFKPNKKLLTVLTHGDAHFKNLIYCDSPYLVDRNGAKVAQDSYKRLSMIDFGTFGRCWAIGADFGRAHGSLLDFWAQQQVITSEKYNEAATLESELNQAYFKPIKECGSGSEKEQKILEEKYHKNWAAHLLRFIRAIENAERHPQPEKNKEIKLTVIKWWLQKATELGFFAEYNQKNLCSALYYLGENYVWEGDDEAAIECFAEAANEGYRPARASLKLYASKKHASAQFRFAQQCIREDNDSEAIRWLYKAAQQKHEGAEEILIEYAEQGHAEAQFRFGQLCKRKRENEAAIRYFIKAAEKGHERALSTLALYAQRGSPEIQFCVGKIYERHQDYQKAIHWFNEAAKQRHQYAQLKLKSYNRFPVAQGRWQH